MNWNVCASAGILAQDQGADTKALDAQPAPSPLGFPVRAFSVAGAPEATPVKKPAVAPAVDASFPAGNQTTEAAPNKTEVAPPPASLKVCCFCLFTKAHTTLILCMGYIKLPDTHFLNQLLNQFKENILSHASQNNACFVRRVSCAFAFW